jgi:hypothetical protein
MNSEAAFRAMNRRTVLASILSALFLGATLNADNEIGFVEKFALAPDREAVLGQLVPGTEDYYFFHALHYQNTGQKPKLAPLLEQWAKRYPDSARRRIIENREALLAYDADPQTTLKFLYGCIRSLDFASHLSIFLPDFRKPVGRQSELISQLQVLCLQGLDIVLRGLH